MTNRELLCDFGYEDVVLFEDPEYDEAIIGVTDDFRAVYDFDLMVECLVNNYSMSEMEAADFICFNASFSTSDMPVIMYRLPV